MSKTQRSQTRSISDDAQTPSPQDHSQQITISIEMFKKILQKQMQEPIEMSLNAATRSASDKFRLDLDSTRAKPQGSANHENSQLLIKLEEQSKLICQFNRKLQQVEGDQEKLFNENTRLRIQNMKLKSQLEFQKFLNQNLIQKQILAKNEFENKCNELKKANQLLQNFQRKEKQFDSLLAHHKRENQKLTKQIQQAVDFKNKAGEESKNMQLQFQNTLSIISSKLSDILKNYKPNWKPSNDRACEAQITQITEALKTQMAQKSKSSKDKEELFKKMVNALFQSNKTLNNRLNQSNASKLGQIKPIKNFELAKNFISWLETQLKTNDENAQKISAEYIETIKFFERTINIIVKNWNSHSNGLQNDAYQKEKKIEENQKTIKGLQEQIKSLKIQQQQLKRNLSSNKNEIKQKENFIEGLKQKIADAEGKLQVEVNKCKNLSQRLDKSQRERNLEEEKLKGANIKIAQHENKIRQLTNNINSLNNQIQQTNRRSTILSQDKDKQTKRLTSELNIQKTNLSNAKIEHKNEVQRLTRQFEKKSLQTKNNYLKEIQKLQDQLSARKKEISSLQKIFKESGQEIQSLQKKVSDLIKQIQDVKKSASSFLCQSDIFSPRINPDQQHINFIKSSIQSYKGKTIIGSRTLARKAHRLNYHSFIDNIPNVMVIVKLVTGRIVAGFSEHPFAEERFGGSKKGGGILMNVSLQKTYHLKGQETHKGIQYDKFFVIWGNSELRIKCLSQEFYSNFGIGQSNYNSEKDQVNDFLGGTNNEREIAPLYLQFVEILFEGIPSIKGSRQWYEEVV